MLTILSATEITIRNTNSASNRIRVGEGVSANITLENVNINTSYKDGAAAFEIAENSTGDVTVTLKGENKLKSGYGCAGLQKNSDTLSGTLTIEGTGTLTAAGGENGAGIGGGNRGDGIDVNINDSLVIDGDTGTV